MAFSDSLGVIICRCVLETTEPVLFVSHAGGDWQMYCRDTNHNFEDELAMKSELVVAHIAHLVAQDPTLNEISDLAVDMGAERSHVGGAWTGFKDSDEL
jgi:hypothetical protein